jgi:hypothetical protein
VEILGSKPARAPTPAPPAPRAPEPASAPEEGASDAEILPSQAAQARDPDLVLKHDLRIWDPRARLQQVKQAAKAQSFDSTGAASGPASPWLRGLKK